MNGARAEDWFPGSPPLPQPVPRFRPLLAAVAVLLLLAAEHYAFEALFPEIGHEGSMLVSIATGALALGLVGALLDRRFELFRRDAVARLAEHHGALASDIGDRERAERAARRHAEQYRSLVQALYDTATDAIITIDEHGKVLSMNHGGERMFGYREDEIRGRDLGLLMPSPLRDGHRDHIEHYVATGQGRVIGNGLEGLAQRRDGSVFPVDIAVSKVLWDGRRMFTGIVRDITDRKQLEQEFLHAQKMEAVGRLAGGIAHDFNNLLMGIIGCCRVALSRLSPGDQARPLLDDIESEAQRGTALVRQLLAFSRRRKPDRAPIVLEQTIGDAGKMIRHLIPEDIALTVDIADTRSTIVAATTQIEQVLMNLVVNARDAMPAGGQLTIETTTCEPRAPGRPAELEACGYGVLRVRDTGIGMDASTRQKVFEPFFTTKDEGQGTGLGLSTVYGIVEQLGGHIALDSAPGRGTTVSVYLPVQEAEVSERDGPPPRSACPAGHGERVLVVEDNTLVRVSVRHTLTENGYCVLEAADAEQARALVREHGERLAVLLTDVVLPGASGPDLARWARGHCGATVLYMSAYPRGDLLERGRLGPDDLSLQKPFADDELLGLIARALAPSESSC